MIGLPFIKCENNYRIMRKKRVGYMLPMYKAHYVSMVIKELLEPSEWQFNKYHF